MTLTDRDLRLICLWLAGWKTDAIATELGMSRRRMRHRAHEVGLPRRKIRALNLWPSIVAWARQGYDPMEIAKALKCTKPEVMAGCGNEAGVSRGTRRAPIAIAVRVKASKRAWATRKRQKQAREAAARAEAEAGKIGEAA